MRSPTQSPEFTEWDVYTPRKPYVRLPSPCGWSARGQRRMLTAWTGRRTQGVLRNDRTPLNTPYTPQLVKLHMKRHDEYEYHAEADRAESLLTRVAASVRAKMAVLARPVRRIRCVLDTVSEDVGHPVLTDTDDER